jgi:hypothetical protein
VIWVAVALVVAAVVVGWVAVAVDNRAAARVRQAALQRATPAFLRDATPQTVDLYYDRVESRRWST